MDAPFDRRRKLRLELRARRAALSTTDQDAASIAVIARLARVAVLESADLVAGYRAVRGELNIDGAMALLVARGISVSVPRVAGEYLEFLPWDMTGVTIDGAFGIPEPADGRARPLIAHDVVLTPLVAFDRFGNRLGQGGGFYDRALGCRTGAKPTIIGVAHAFQEVDSIPSEKWDVPLDAIVTEEAITEFRAGCLDETI